MSDHSQRCTTSRIVGNREAAVSRYRYGKGTAMLFAGAASGCSHGCPIAAATQTRTVLAAILAWANCTAIAPSPTAAAQRFEEPERTSPAAKMPGTLVSSG